VNSMVRYLESGMWFQTSMVRGSGSGTQLLGTQIRGSGSGTQWLGNPELGIWFRNSINGLGPRVRALVGELNGLGPGIRDPVQGTQVLV
jgi:hypothetical protein